MTIQKNILVLAMLALYSSASASEVWERSGDRLDNQLKKTAQRAGSEGIILDPTYGQPTLEEKKDRINKTEKLMTTGFQDHAFNTYAEYLYTMKHFVELPNTVYYPKDRFHHYPYRKGGGSNNVLPSAYNKAKYYLEGIYYPIKSRELLADALGLDNIKKNGGKIIYQANDPQNQIDLEDVMGLGAQGKEHSEYLTDKSGSMASQHGFLNEKRDPAKFDDIISKTEKTQETNKNKKRSDDEFCRTLLCLLSASTDSECTQQIARYLTKTAQQAGSKPWKIPGLRFDWLQSCAISTVSELMGGNGGGVLGDMQNIYGYSNDQMSSITPTSNPIEEQKTAASFTKLNRSLSKGTSFDCKVTAYNQRNRLIRFNWDNPQDRNQNPRNPFFIIEARVLDDQLDEECQEYVDHEFVHIYRTPIYRRNIPTSDYKNSGYGDQVFLKSWLSDAAIKHYENNARNEQIKRKVTQIHAKTLFGKYYNAVPEFMRNQSFSISAVLSNLSAVKQSKNRAKLIGSSTFEQFIMGATSNPVFDLVKRQNYYFGHWSAIPEYQGENTLRQDSEYSWDIPKIRNGVQNYGNTQEERRRNKEIMLNEIKKYKRD